MFRHIDHLVCTGIVLILVMIGGFSSRADATMVDFTLSLDTTADPGSTYTGFHKAGEGVDSVYVIGFQVTIDFVDSDPVGVGPIATFCVELSESISTGAFQFDAGLLKNTAAGRAGEGGTASSDIPAGGIGELRAAQVRYLFDNYYQSETLANWTNTSDVSYTQAFQLALWEVTHDADLSLSDTTGSIYVADQTSAFRNNTISLAQEWLDDINDANLNTAYQSLLYEIWALLDEDGQGDVGYQDVLLGLRNNTNDYDILGPLLPTPEPGSLAILGLSSLLFLRRRARDS